MEHLLFKATLAAAVLTFFIILFTRKENNYLSAAGGNTKKLMVVDQTTGAITFLNNSVKGIDDQFTNSDATQAALLKTLFGPNLDGAAGIFKTKMDELLAIRDTKITTLEGHNTAEWKAFAGGNGGASLRTRLNNSIIHGAQIMIESNASKTGDDGKRAILQNTCGWAGNHDCDAKFRTNKTRPTSHNDGDPHGLRHTILKLGDARP